MSGDELFEQEPEVDEELAVCWRDNNRACGDDCVAFDDRIEEDPRYRPCIVLNVYRQQSNALANLANAIKALAGPSSDEMAKVMKQFQEFQQRKQAVDDLPEPPEIKT